MVVLQNQLLQSVKTNKQVSTAQQGSKHGKEEATKHRAEKKNTLADSNYFHTEELIACTNFCTHTTLFVCTLLAQL